MIRISPYANCLLSLLTIQSQKSHSNLTIYLKHFSRVKDRQHWCSSQSPLHILKASLTPIGPRERLILPVAVSMSSPSWRSPPQSACNIRLNPENSAPQSLFVASPTSPLSWSWPDPLLSLRMKSHGPGIVPPPARTHISTASHTADALWESPKPLWDVLRVLLCSQNRSVYHQQKLQQTDSNMARKYDSYSPWIWSAH